MSKQVQIRGGNTTFEDAFLGVSREITVDTDANRIRVHDGVLVGGYALALVSEVAAKQNLLGFTPEDVSNKDTDVALTANSDTMYPSQKAIKTYVDTKQAMDGDLTAVAALASTGLAARTAADTWAVRTLTGTANQILISNGGGVLGDPTFSTPQNIHTAASPQFARIGLGGVADAANLLELTLGTIVADAKAIDATATWNNSAVTFSGFKLTVTNTASSASSYLLDVRTNTGASYFTVDAQYGSARVSGSLTVAGGMNVAQVTLIDGIIQGYSVNSRFFTNTTGVWVMDNTASDFTSLNFGGSTSSYPAIGRNGAAFDFLAADLAGPINLYLYNTKTSGTNYERLDFLWGANVAKIWTEKGSGGGTARDLILGADATELIRFQAGTKLSFYGATPIVKQTSGADLTNNVTSGGSSDVIANFTDLTVYANDSAAIRNDIYQLSRKLKQVNDALRAYGILT